MTKLSVIMPTLNEADNIGHTLQSLQYLRIKGHEIILVDGGSSDNTIDIGTSLVDKVLLSKKGRAQQMNNAAKAASGDIFLFLHADTRLPEKADELIFQHTDIETLWGRFDLRFTGRTPLLRLISICMNIRTAISGIITGDHALFIDRALFERINGFPDIPIMEDIAISQKLLHYRRPIRIQKPLTTSSRRWEKHGIIKTVLLMWWLRLLFFLGVDAKKLAHTYYPDHFSVDDETDTKENH